MKDAVSDKNMPRGRSWWKEEKREGFALQAKICIITTSKYYNIRLGIVAIPGGRPRYDN